LLAVEQRLCELLASTHHQSITRMQALVKTRPTLEAAVPLLDLPVLPVAATAVTKLTDAVTRTSAWIAHVSAAGSAPFQLADAQALLEEGLALPLHTAEVTHLQDSVAAASAARDRLVAALEGGGPLEEHDARAVHTAIAATRLTFPEAQRLEEALRVLGDWQARARAADSARAPLAELQALKVEAAALPVACAEVGVLGVKLEAAAKWVAQAREAMERRAPLKEMRRLLHAGERQPVDIPEVGELKLYIRRREWEEAAGRALQSKTTVTAAMQLLAEAPAMAVDGDSMAVARLREAIAAVREWDTSAADLQDRCAAAATAAADAAAVAAAPSVDEVAVCLQAAAPLRLRSERHAALAALVARAARWRTSAQVQLDRGGGGVTAAAAPLAALEAAAAEGAALGLREPLLAMLAERIDSVRRAGVAVAALLEQPLGSGDLPRLEEALSSAAAVGVPSSTAAALTERRDALRWEADARSALNLEGSSNPNNPDNSGARPALPEVLDLLRRAAAVPVDTELRERVLETALHGFAWEVQACDVLGSKLCGFITSALHPHARCCAMC
jgi:hypothetical protein